MIDISQWRAVIGTFNLPKLYRYAIMQDDDILHEYQGYETRSNLNCAVVSFCILHCVLVVILLYTLLTSKICSPVELPFIFHGLHFILTFNNMCNENLLTIVISILHQLILCGDIETNPGPTGFKIARSVIKESIQDL